MWRLLLAAFIDLVELHGLGGQRYFVNPNEITSIREPQGEDKRQFGPGMRCIVMTVSGQFLAVRESCDAVRAKLTQGNR